MPKMKLPTPFEYDVITMRGIIIAHTIEVERNMDDFLSRHFCSTLERKNELCELLFFTESMSFQTKKVMAFAILDSHYKRFKNKHRKFVQFLSDMSPYRNVFAHLEIELDKCESIETPLGTEVSTLVFKKYKSGKYDPAIYSITQLNKLSEKMNYIINGFKTLLIEMPPLT